MPTKREREYYRMGFKDGQEYGNIVGVTPQFDMLRDDVSQRRTTRPKRKLSAWNKFVKANSKKPRFRLRSGSPNLKKLGVAFRKTPAGKKKK